LNVLYLTAIDLCGLGWNICLKSQMHGMPRCKQQLTRMEPRRSAGSPPTCRTPQSLQEPPKHWQSSAAGRVGRIGNGGPERLSEACGEKCTDYVEAKRKAGHL